MGEEFIKIFTVIQLLGLFVIKFEFKNSKIKEFILKYSAIKNSNIKERVNSELEFKVNKKILRRINLDNLKVKAICDFLLNFQ